MKKILFLFIFSFSFLFSENLNLYLFTTKECPHCKKEKIFLEKIKKKYSYLNVQNIDIYSSTENQKLFELHR